ncbi:hypothetical protein [Natronorubrum halophilum]|uniref:hypothetical protein n=1 Tax=Natronorubrum halophilum TaxID=1702106 RepID=UPI000EF6CE73|nr:hypothetical protein [Natronorubrum halophilum]
MTDDSVRTPSRRHFLGAAAGTATTAVTAGCLGSLVDTTSSTQIEPEPPSDPREGSPGEFYYFLEENGIEVDELAREDDELYLTYRSEAEAVEESDEEIWLIYEVYKRALIRRGSEIEFLYTEIANPFDGQALGWGINSEWVHQFDSDETARDENESDIDGSTTPDRNETAGNGTAGNETTEDGLDMNQITLWNNIMNSKVYAEDLEDDDSAPDDGNQTSDDSNADETVDNESDD